jgi:signal transduction histidine kinase
MRRSRAARPGAGVVRGPPAPHRSGAVIASPTSRAADAGAPAVAKPEAPPEGLARSFLGAPLLTKLVVTDLALNFIAFVVVRDAPVEYAGEITMAALLATLVVNAALVYWALLPLRELEATAERVSAGDLGARVPRSRLADRNFVRIGNTLNQLLDHLTADRVRMRHLASQVISAGDQERAHIARELHDSTAQSLSALEMLVATSARETPPGPLHERLGVMRGIVVEALTEVRTLSHNVHPRVLDDLGLVSALEFLARRTREGSGVAVRVSSDVTAAVPAAVASVLYRVAQEAVRNAVRHAGARDLHIALAANRREARLEVVDDGAGFDVAAADAARAGMGLFLMRERLALIDGHLDVVSRPGRGTTVRATAPALSADGEGGT